MRKDQNWLLNLDHTPTVEELKEHFRENDFSSAAVMELDYDTLPADTVEGLEYIKSLMKEPWEENAQKMGMRSSDNYGKDNPMIAMRDNMADLVSTSVYKLLDEHPENAMQILNWFDFDDPDIDKKVDAFLNNAISKTMEVMDFQKLAAVMKEIPTYEDFNHKKKSNEPAIDFHRKWNHSRTKTQMVSLDEMTELENDSSELFSNPMADASVDMEEQAFANLKVREFWASLNDDERELLELKISGMTTQEIADELGLKSHSAVVKRLQKMRKKYDAM